MFIKYIFGKVGKKTQLCLAPQKLGITGDKKGKIFTLYPIKHFLDHMNVVFIQNINKPTGKC